MPESPRPIALSENLLFAVGETYLVILIIAGILTNFLPLGGINTGTICLYSLASVLSAIGVSYLANPLRKEVALPVILVLVLTMFSMIKAILDSNPLSERLRELAIFSLGVWPFLFFVQLKDFELWRRFCKTLFTGLVGLSVFGVFQGIFANYLPVNLFVLRGDDTFGLYGVDTLRPTGLTGNPIIFSSILVFASAYFASLWFETRRKLFLGALVLSLLTNYLTYTRTSLVLVIPVIFCAWILQKRFRIKHKWVFIVVLLLLTGGVQLVLVKAADLMIVQRLQNANPEAAVSTLDHIEQIQRAREAIWDHPWLGTGMGSNSDFAVPDEIIITDGAWWSLFLEFGAPLSILILLSLGAVLTILMRFVLHKQSKNRALAIATLAYHAYLIPGNFVNSGILGHISFGIYFVALGLSLASTRFIG